MRMGICFYEKTKFNEFESLKQFKDFSYFSSPSSCALYMFVLRGIHFMMIIYLIFFLLLWAELWWDGGVQRRQRIESHRRFFLYHKLSSLNDEKLSTEEHVKIFYKSSESQPFVVSLIIPSSGDEVGSNVTTFHVIVVGRWNRFYDLFHATRVSWMVAKQWLFGVWNKHNVYTKDSGETLNEIKKHRLMTTACGKEINSRRKKMGACMWEKREGSLFSY